MCLLSDNGPECKGMKHRPIQSPPCPQRWQLDGTDRPWQQRSGLTGDFKGFLWLSLGLTAGAPPHGVCFVSATVTLRGPRSWAERRTVVPDHRHQMPQVRCPMGAYKQDAPVGPLQCHRSRVIGRFTLSGLRTRLIWEEIQDRPGQRCRRRRQLANGAL